MKLKVLTCDCFLPQMNDTDVEFEVQNRFDACECGHLPHRIAVTKCGFHDLNVNGFFRHYFASVIFLFIIFVSGRFSKTI